MSYNAIDLAMRTNGLTSSEKAVLICLSWRMNDHSGTCNPSIPSICEVMAMGHNTVRSCIKSLEEKGLIERVIRNRNTQSFKLNLGSKALPKQESLNGYTQTGSSTQTGSRPLPKQVADPYPNREENKERTKKEQGREKREIDKTDSSSARETESIDSVNEMLNACRSSRIEIKSSSPSVLKPEMPATWLAYIPTDLDAKLVWKDFSEYRIEHGFTSTDWESTFKNYIATMPSFVREKCAKPVDYSNASAYVFGNTSRKAAEYLSRKMAFSENPCTSTWSRGAKTAQDVADNIFGVLMGSDSFQFNVVMRTAIAYRFLSTN